MKTKKLVAQAIIVQLVLGIGVLTNVNAWWFSFDFNSFGRKGHINGNSIKDVETTFKNTVSYFNKIEKEYRNKRKEYRNKINLIKKVMYNKAMYNIEKKNLKLAKKIEKKSKDVREEIVKMQVISRLKNVPVVSENLKPLIENNIKKLTTDVKNEVSQEIKKLAIPENKLQVFELTTTFDPKKVITFDDIKVQSIINLQKDLVLLGCDNPFDSVKNMCAGINNLINNLSVKKKLTINDIYLLQVYQGQIDKAISYIGALNQYKKAAVVMGIDKQSNILRSIDIVRNYTDYDTENNDVLLLNSKYIKIGIQNKVPTFKSNQVGIVLGLDNGSIRGVKLYPVQSDLRIYGAKTYKYLAMDGLRKCSNDNNWTQSIWINTITAEVGIGTKGKLYPNKQGVKALLFDLKDKCYGIKK